MSQPAIYSYSRISSKKQERGTGIVQQKLEDTKLEELSSTYGLPISNEVFSDIGKSAYHGAHLADGGALGQIIALINDGTIAKGSILTIFNLDRISRARSNRALEPFLAIINRGVMIYVATEDKVLSEDSPNLDVDLIFAILSFARANEESRLKAKRTIGNAMTLIKNHEGGARAENGYAFAVKSCGASHAWYIDVTDGTVKPHEYYWPIAKLMASMLTAGKSIGEVKAELDTQFTPPVKTAKASKTAEATWHTALICRFHSGTALNVDRKLKIQGVEYVLKDYFPRLLSDNELLALKAARAARSTYSPSSGKVNIVTGMGIARCHVCYGSIGVQQIKGKTSRYSFYCIRSQKGESPCSGFNVKGEYVERALLQLVPDAIKAAARPKPVLQDLSILDVKLADKDATLAKMADMAMLDGLPDALVTKMRELQVERDDLAAEIEAIRDTKPLDLDLIAEEWSTVSGELPPLEDTEARQLLKALVKESIERITIHKLNGYSHHRFYFELKNGNVRTIDCKQGVLSDMRTDALPVAGIDGMRSGTHMQETDADNKRKSDAEIVQLKASFTKMRAKRNRKARLKLVTRGGK